MASSDDEAEIIPDAVMVDDINGEMQGDDITSCLTEDSDSDGEEYLLDALCAICDNGGLLTCCEGKCRRPFHATPAYEGAEDANCESLCLTSNELEGQRFKCENCQYSLHQCFVCAELGSSDKSSNTEVFCCSFATCRHFYHPKCVVKLLQPNDITEQQTLVEKIAAGESFICPSHKCAVCKQTENEMVEDLQFAICRRCPKSYHRKCLPRDIMFDHQTDNYAEIRAWDGLLPKSRALIYCLEHEIVPELATPARTIIFRDVLERMREQIREKKTVLKSEPYDPSLALSMLGRRKSKGKAPVGTSGGDSNDISSHFSEMNIQLQELIKLERERLEVDKGIAEVLKGRQLDRDIKVLSAELPPDDPRLLMLKEKRRLFKEKRRRNILSRYGL